MNYYTGELYHHGILGQKWGVRRFQNPDGTLTPAGKERYSSPTEQKRFAKMASKHGDPFSSITMRTGQDEKIRRSSQVQHAASMLREKGAKTKASEDKYDNLVDKFYKNKELYEKYLNKAVDHRMKTDPWIKEDGITRDQLYSYFKYEDMDQGDYSSIELYKRSGEKGSRELASAEKEWINLSNDLSKSAREYVDMFLGDYGNESLSPLKWYGHGNAKTRVQWILEKEAKRPKFTYFPM